MDQLTDYQLAVAARVTDAIKASQDIPVALLNRIVGLMQSTWAPGYADVFAGLGDRAAALESQLGVLIGAYLYLGGTYASLPKPPVCYVKTSDGRILPTACPFPASSPLARWSIPAANLTAAQAIAAGTDESILDALTAAQPA